MKVTIDCPDGYEERMIAYAKEAIEIALREDEYRKVEPEVTANVEAVTSKLAVAEIDGKVVDEDINDGEEKDA